MKLTVLLAALMMTVSAWGSDCPVADLSAYDAPGFSCTVGDKMFSDFTFVASGSTHLTAGQITVTPGSNFGVHGNEIGLQFNADWSAGTGQSSDTVIEFTVSVIGGKGLLIDDASTVQSSSGFTGTGFAGVTEGLCGPAPCLTSGDTTTVTTAGTTQLNDHIVFTPTGSVHAIKDIGVAGGSNGTAQISQVIDSFSQTSVPEPASILMLGGVLLGLALIGRKRYV